jgi:tetratricopeptide (TPR) repeat protein
MRGTLVVLLSSLLFMVSCGRGPQGYLEKGNSFFNSGNYNEAALNYRKALQKDPRFGEAQYRLGLTELKRRNSREAYAALSAAAELLPERADVQTALSNFLLSSYLGDKRRPTALYTQLSKLSDQLLARNPNSYDGLRIKAHLVWSDGRFKEAAVLFGKANAVQPMQKDLVPAWTQTLFQDGQFAEGERLAREFLEKHKDSGQIYDVLYVHYRSQNRPADAENILRTKVANNPSEIDYALQLASYYAANGKPEQVSATLGPLTKPGAFNNAYLKVGDFYSAHQDWPQALRLYEEGLKSDPKQKTTYRKRIADAWLSQGKGEEAAGVVGEILKDQPDDEGARAVNASILIKAGKLDAGLKEFQDLVTKSPDNPLWRYSLGRALLEKGDLNGAGLQLKESIKRRPDFLPPRLALADVSRQKRDYAQTVKSADEILAVNANLPGVRLLRVVGLIGERQYSRARSELDSLEREFPREREVQFELASVDLAEGKFPAAEARFQKLYNEGKGSPAALAGLVETYRAENHPDKAMALLTSEVKKSPDSETVRSLLGDLALQSGKYDLALEQYQFLLAKGTPSLQLQMRLGMVYEVKKDYPKAIASFQAAKDLAPRDPGTNTALADALRLSGRKPEAIAGYRSALALEPENAVVMNNLAFMLVDGDGKIEEAQSLAERAVQKAPENPHFADTLGLVYLKKKLGDSAVHVFQNLAKKYPDNPTFRYHYGLALVESGQKARAKAELEAALPKKPSEDVRKGIETALAGIR